MNPQDPLAALKPLREPPPIEWWPPAPGWWLLLACALLAIAVLTALWLRHRRRTAYRRAALKQLNALEAAHRSDNDYSAQLAQINALLKRVALIAFPTRDVARLHGEQWLAFLHGSAANQPPFSTELSNAHYRQGADNRLVREAHRCAAHWIRHHEVSR